MTVEYLRDLCFDLPHTADGIKWEDHLCYMIAGKMYCITSLADPIVTSIKTTEEDFEILIAREGIIPAPYMARNKWVQIADPESLNIAEWQEYVTKSYSIIKSKLPKKTLTKLEESQE